MWLWARIARRLLTIHLVTGRPVDMMRILSPVFQRAIHHPHQRDHTDVVVEPGVDDERLERAVGIALGRRDALDQRLQQLGHALAGLGADLHGIGGIDTDDLFDLLGDLVGIGGREVDLIDDGQDFDALLERRVAVGDALGLDTLGGVDDQQGAIARGQRARHFIREVHVPGRVDHVELVLLAILRRVVQGDARGLDGDSPLALELHGIQDLRLHFAVLQTAAELDQPVGQGGLTVIDVGDNRKVTYVPHESAILAVGTLFHLRVNYPRGVLTHRARIMHERSAGHSRHCGRERSPGLSNGG